MSIPEKLLSRNFLEVKDWIGHGKCFSFGPIIYIWHNSVHDETRIYGIRTFRCMSIEEIDSVLKIINSMSGSSNGRMSHLQCED